MLELDAVQTLAFAGLALFLGYALCRVVPLFNRYNLPAPVIGGLVVALAVLVARSREVTLFTLDTSLQAPLMIAFFTTIGVNASVALLKLSGRQVLVFLLLASAFAIVQNLLGMAVALGFDLHPLFGVLAGSTTLTGGPATRRSNRLSSAQSARAVPYRPIATSTRARRFATSARAPSAPSVAFFRVRFAGAAAAAPPATSAASSSFVFVRRSW